MSSEKIVNTVRIAATADIHHGHPREKDGEFGTRAQWSAWFEGAQTAGAQILILGGDNTHTGKAHEAKEIARLAKTMFGSPIYAINGNHDKIGGKEDEMNLLMEKEGVTVLDNKAEIIDIQGVRIGLVGMNGSMNIDEFHKLPIDQTRWEKVHERTEELYGEIFGNNLDFLLQNQNMVDYILPIIHIPIHIDQYSDTNPPEILKDMTPKIYKRICAVKENIAAVIGGHVHSLRSESYRRRDPYYETKDGISMINVAAPNAIRQGENPIFLFDIILEKSKEEKKITVRRVKNG